MSEIAKYIEIDESPEKIFGRLSESVHLAGYSFERALMGLEYLLENDRWKQLGKGYTDIDVFIRDLNFSNYRILAEERKSLAKKLNELRVSNRATAEMLGVNRKTIDRDISGTNVPIIQNNDIDNQYDINIIGTNDPPPIPTKPFTPAPTPPPAPSPFKTSPEDVMKKQMSELKRDAKKQERQELINQIVNEIEQNNIVAPDGNFDVVVVDPPWAYGTKFDSETRRVANPYPEMSQDELLQIDIPASDNSVLFLWTTHRFIWDAYELLNNWGFTYRNLLVWDKEKIGMGDLFRMQVEICLVGIKGKPLFNNDHTIRDIIREPRREHSRKPDAFYDMVDKLCIGRKIDYFSREQRDGWNSFGAETNKF